MKILCVFGKFQYGEPARGQGLEYDAFIPAFRRLGHEVHHFDSWRKGVYSDYADLNKCLLEAVSEINPDILFTVHMEYELWIETLEIIGAREGITTISWAADDSWKYKEVSRFVGPSYHLMTTTYAYMLDRYRADGIAQVFLTQWAASSDFLSAPLKASSCRYPVTFVGAAHGNRRDRIEYIRAAGFDVMCFGHGWENGPVDAQTYAQICRESFISLNFANSRGPNQIKARCFEVLGAGGALLTEEVEGIENYYRVGEEVEVFNSDARLIERLRYFYDNPDIRDQMAIAGSRRTASEHTYERRLQSVLKFSALNRHHSQHRAAPDFLKAQLVHRRHNGLSLLRALLVGACTLIFGKQRGVRAARRLVFELSWRVVGRHTFTAAGWPGRMFPDC
jgi:spore maturation protein CgeB